MYSNGALTFGLNAACACRTSSEAMRSFKMALWYVDAWALARRKASSSVSGLTGMADELAAGGVTAEAEGDGEGVCEDAETAAAIRMTKTRKVSAGLVAAESLCFV